MGVALWLATPIIGKVRLSSYLPNLHAYNDYSRNHLFELAYDLGFGSIEVDLFFNEWGTI